MKDGKLSLIVSVLVIIFILELNNLYVRQLVLELDFFQVNRLV